MSEKIEEKSIKSQSVKLLNPLTPTPATLTLIGDEERTGKRRKKERETNVKRKKETQI